MTIILVEYSETISTSAVQAHQLDSNSDWYTMHVLLESWNRVIRLLMVKLELSRAHTPR